ncbi:MAG: protein kinase [Kofleriaceae bacterium]|nr:protein kinase [Kofleriaceae bacterium]
MPPEPTAAPVRVGRYEVITHLATGGMAQIYLARQSGLGSFERHVVLKTILRERANDQRFVTMFLDEARLAATLNHQNVAQVYEVDQADGAYFMAMEYVHGENARAILETSLRRGWTIPLELAVMIVGGAAAGLHHAHERRGKNGQPLNIVHRDVSPANIMVGFDGSVKVLDFGIAKAEERATKTVGGTIKGKYGYMSPEQCKGKSIDRRSDIFALGIVLYELTTLRRAFKGNDDFETMKRIVSGDIVLPSAAVPGYPRELEAIILTALANDPAQRFQTAQELIEALDTFAVRAKLTGSNTALGRFMNQLFGTKKEPWIEGARGERTVVSDPMSSDSDNEETIAVEQKIPAEAMREHGRGETQRDPDPGDDDVAWRNATTVNLGMRATTQARVSPTPAPRAPSPAHDDNLDLDAHATVLGIGSAPPPKQTPSPIHHKPVAPAPAMPPIQPPRSATSVPPVVQAPPMQPPVAMRPASDVASTKVKTSSTWILVAVFFVLGAGGAVAALLLTR